MKLHKIVRIVNKTCLYNKFKKFLNIIQKYSMSVLIWGILKKIQIRATL